MSYNQILETFKTLGLPFQHAPANYSPDEYGKMLHEMFPQRQGVSYSTSTELKEEYRKDYPRREKKD